MKKRFLPISLLLTIILLAQTSFVVNANSDSGKYTPRTAEQATAQSFMKSIRANQETGLIDPAWLVATENSQSRNSEGLNWSSLGPDNYGSLTRGIVYDKSDATNNTIYIGTMGGGIFKSVNGGITWKTMNTNMMVSCMAQTEDGSIYVGTGDGRSAQKTNGLAELNYETSFEGCGLYEVKSNKIIEGTENWKFINDVATNGNTVYAATNDGLYSYENNTLTALADTVTYGVEVTPNGTVLAVVGSDVCIFRNGECEVLTNDSINKLPKGNTYKIIAVSPTDDNYMYVNYLTTGNGTGNIYMTSDQGKTWQVAYKSTTLYEIHGSRGLLDNAMVVYPENPRKLLIGGLNLWVMRDEFGEGIFRLECISDGSGHQIAQSGGAFYYNYKYVHTGIQTVTFNPNNSNEFLIGTEGGVFKGSYSSNGYLYEGINRYFETAENHTSVTRMFNVAFSGEKDMTLGGSLDHGTINVYGKADLNNVTTGSAIFPNDIATTDAAATYGAFDFTKAGGPCAISTIDPNIMFVTTTGSYAIGNAYTPLFRTQTAGADYDKENFSYSATDNTAYISNSNAFRTPIVLFENYNDNNSVDSVMYYAKTTFYKGDTIKDVRSDNSTYPFDYILTQDSLVAGDSILVQDIISTTFLVATEGKVIMTRDALKFNKKANWWSILGLKKDDGIPNALSLSADGDVAYVGTAKGKLYRIENISEAVTQDLTVGIPAVVELKVVVTDTTYNEVVDFDTIWSQKPVYDTTFANDTAWVNDTIIRIDEIVTIDTVYTTKKVNDTVAQAVPSIIKTTEIDATPFNGQAITSIAIDPQNFNNVIVTLGNYGNETYVLNATDGLTFTSVQNNLPKVPVYSSLIENTTGIVMIGTEKGIYTSEDMTNWTADNTVANIPVMEIKQQLLENHDPRYVYLVDEVGDITTIGFPSIKNNGVVYIATYGRGLYKCEDFVQKEGESIVENITSSTSALEMSIYPNPVVSEATINFNIEATATVSYQIYDLSGRMVQNATLGNYGQGSHSVNFNVDGLSNGTYIVKVQAGSVTNTAKILVY
ncbi:MAG: T9SS type A sorting domain-containing protein [Bacteroidales bacterium]|nr:T9SS type A sorting domain-containing protein [Bacteroidales bacterium]